VLSPAEARGYRVRLEAVEREQGGPLRGALRHKSRPLFTWLDALGHHQVILGAVEDIIGPDILLWSSSFFIKEARDPAFVSWHQDATYWGLSEPDVVTAWVALSESSSESGAMRMVPGTHHEQVAHQDTFAHDNLLSRGQEAGARGSALLVRGVDTYHYFDWLARAYLEGHLKLDELITLRLRLKQVNEGFAGMAKGNVVRAVLLLN
jgi:hypothetical protein